ncbi:MAG TPA: HlyD family efflux transporter periplasmic adaptor subunit [Candidatus Polarisedimenticolia bacterium]|nr:HlyD family efflux transporter periplasmic adaptor subunit [Candidatus Polarisedimenticolia bacterium]
MSSSPRASLPRGLRRRSVLAGGAVVLALLAVAGLRGSGPEVSRPVTVKRQDLVQTVEMEGELQAVRSTEIGVPPVQNAEFKIAFLIPEGTVVKKGQPVLGFDTEALQRQLVEKQAEFQEAAKKVDQKEIDLGLKLLDVEQRSAQAVAELGKAKLKAEVPAEVQQRIELEKARLDHQGRERDLENLQAEKRVTQTLGDSELRSLRNQRDRAKGRVEELQAAIEKMTVKAPHDGIVVYRTNWQDQKKKVGDSMWFGETALAIPDLSEMRAEGFVDEAEGGAVAAGQPVTLRLEARPDLDIQGRVRAVGRTVRRRSWRTPLKVYKVDVALTRTDPTLMRPSMRFRGEAETGRTAGLLVMPREVVFLRDAGPVVWVRRAFRWTERPVRLGRSNRRQVEVSSGLREGDRVSPVDLLDSAAPPRSAEATGR